MKKINLSKKKIVLFIFGLIMVSSIDFLQNYTTKLSKSYHTIVLDKNWTFCLNDEELSKNVSISELSFPNTSKGDVIVLSNTLPKEKIDNPVILYSVYHSSIQVMVNNNKIYEYGSDMIKNNILIGNTSHTINLPDDYMGKRITITLHVGEDDAFSSIDDFTIIDETNNFDFRLRSSFQVLFISVNLFVFGIIIMLTIIIKGSFYKELRKLFWIALMSGSFSIWILSNLSYFGFVLRYKSIISFIEYFSLYLITPAGLMYFYENFSDKKDKIIAKILAIICCTFLFTIVILHFLNIAHISNFLMYSHLLTLICICTSLVRTFNLKKYKRQSEHLSMIAFSWLLVSGVVDLIRFNLMKYIIGSSSYSTLMPTSVLVFVILMIISYLVYIREYLAEVAAKNVLTKLAYNDTLTGIANRTYCEEKLHTLENENAKEFSIVYFDLNNLKKLNDEKGHIAGDQYICDFSNLLNSTFAESGLVGRMGGDEFIVIMNSTDSSFIIKKIMNMIESSERPYSDYKQKRLSFAYGYAVSTLEKPLTVKEVYDKADKRMYECKKKQKEQ